jgi:hypothetical protein
MSGAKKNLRCDHGCRIDDLKNIFEQHCEELDEALDYSIEKFVELTMFLQEEVVPYLESHAFEAGDEQAHDLLIDINKRTEWV